MSTNTYEKERKILGRRIAELRTKNKMTQEDLADAADMNVSYLAKIEGGLVNTSVRILIKISKGLKKPVKDLFEF